MQNSDIKSMKLYNNVDRIFNELRELGKADTDSLSVDDLSNFDQLHYHGTDAVDAAIEALGIHAGMSILEIGSGIGGPARHLANKTGATVYALELQADQNDLAADLTSRCGLSGKVVHVCGDFLTHDWGGQTFDAIVSWLALYHIPDHDTLVQRCFEFLKPSGFFYAEDLISRGSFTADEMSQLSSEIFANHLPDIESYGSDLEKFGFASISCQDMSDNWADFSKNRITSYNQQRDRHVRVHGEGIVNSLNSFFSVVDQYFSGGKLGGVRAIARKPS